MSMYSPNQQEMLIATREMEANIKSGIYRCSKCHKIFNETRFWQRFCSPYCRMTYHNRRTAGRNPVDPIKPNLEDLA